MLMGLILPSRLASGRPWGAGCGHLHADAEHGCSEHIYRAILEGRRGIHRLLANVPRIAGRCDRTLGRVRAKKGGAVGKASGMLGDNGKFARHLCSQRDLRASGGA